MSVPEEIRSVKRPIHTIIQPSTNSDGEVRYIVRERIKIRGPDGKVKFQNGCTVGYIVDMEFVEKLDEETKPIDEIGMKTWAVEKLVTQVSHDVLEDLRAIYPEKDAERLFVMSGLLVRNPDINHSRFSRDYRESTFSSTYPSLGMSKNTVCKVYQEVGQDVVSVKSFMELRLKRLDKGAILAVDGTLIEDTSEVNNLSSVSRKTHARGGKDISVIYAYDVKGKKPVCYEIYPGNVPDSKAYGNFIESNDLRDVMMVGDKAFTVNAAKEQFDSDRNLDYMFPLKRNAKVIREYNLYEYDSYLKGFEGILYRVAHDPKEGVWYYSFRDTKRAAKEEVDYIERRKASGKGISDLEKERKKFGTVIYQSNREMEPLDAYLVYKTRWLLETMFKTYKGVLEFDSTNVQSDYSVAGSMFVEFLSMIITSELIDLFDEKKLLDDYDYGTIVESLSRTLRFKRDEKEDWTYRILSDDERDILTRLDLIAPVPKKRPGRPRKNPAPQEVQA